MNRAFPIVRLVACSFAAEGAAATGPVGGAACPRLASAGSLPLRPGGGGILHGDFDGDGTRDVGGIRYAPAARASCRFVLVVKTTRRSWALPLPEWYKPPQDLRIPDWSFAATWALAQRWGFSAVPFTGCFVEHGRCLA